MSSKKILVLAYQISPTRGSEYSVAWNYVINMSKDNELVVIYGASGDHMGDVSELEQYIKESPLPNVQFIAIKPNKVANGLNALNKKGILVYTFYIAFNIWQRQVYQKAKDLIIKEHFDLIHYLGPIGYREPGYLWKINLPYIWGPIGGTTNVSKKLIKALPFTGKLKLGFRAVANTIQLYYNSRVKQAIDNTDILLTATSENQENIKLIFKKDSIYIPENGISGEIIKPEIDKFTSEKINIIWIGRLDERKALIILLMALKQIKNLDLVRIHIVGDGPLKHQLQIYTQKNKLTKIISWHGAIPRPKVINLLSKSHLHIITSVGEGNPTTIWEAMSTGIPTLSLDHCGMHDTICEKCGVKIPIHTYKQVINDLALNLDRLIMNPDEIKRLSDGVIECAKKYSWDHRRNFFNNMYELAIENWKNKNITVKD